MAVKPQSCLEQLRALTSRCSCNLTIGSHRPSRIFCLLWHRLLPNTTDADQSVLCFAWPGKVVLNHFCCSTYCVVHSQRLDRTKISPIYENARRDRMPPGCLSISDDQERINLPFQILDALSLKGSKSLPLLVDQPVRVSTHNRHQRRKREKRQIKTKAPSLG